MSKSHCEQYQRSTLGSYVIQYDLFPLLSHCQLDEFYIYSLRESGC